MKKIFLLIASMIFTVSFLYAQESAVEKKVDPVEWSETTHNFGNLELRKPSTATFTFKNVSEAPVVITNVRSSCGCTVAKYTKEPVKPGEEGEVSATYNAARIGAFTKTVTVTLDALSRPVVLKIKGQVVEKREEEAVGEKEG
jgi:hypothetical protein